MPSGAYQRRSIEVGPLEQVAKAQGPGLGDGRVGGITLMQPRARQPATLICTSSSSSWSRKQSRA